ncbi:hypothetical protein Tco_0688833 [Tanacetum coccineum]
MSMIGVLTYFLRYQIKQSEKGISINQEKYVKDLLKKYDINGSSMKTPMVPPIKLGLDLNGKSVNETQYIGIIGSLMYLTASRPNIQFSSCLHARYQANPKKSYLIAVKKIFSQAATKGGSSKVPIGFITGHLKRKKDSSSTMESNPSQTSASIPLVIEMHKEDQQAIGSPSSSGVTSKERADPQLSCGMSAFNLNKPNYSAYFIIHSESASGYDALGNSIAEADPGKSTPIDFIPQQ